MSICVPLGHGMRSSDLAGGDNDALLQALGAHGLETVDILTLQPTAEPTPRRGLRSAAATPVPETQSTSIDVDVGPDEHAVLLIEQDGMHSWSFPDGAATIRVAQGRLRRGYGFRPPAGEPGRWASWGPASLCGAPPALVGTRQGYRSGRRSDERIQSWLLSRDLCSVKS
jgi:hypothetical protein